MSLLAVAAVAIIGGGVFWTYTLVGTTPTDHTLHYWIENDLTEYKSAITAFAKANELTAVASDQASTDFIITRSSQPGSIAINQTQVGAPIKLETSTIIKPQAQPSAYLTSQHSVRIINGHRLSTLATNLAAKFKTASSDRTWKLNAVGDIIIGRDVYLKMLEYNPLHPFEKYAAELASADLTIADLENAFSDPRAVITSGGMTFVSPSRGAEGLKTSGIDAVNIANNHSYNGGAQGYLDTITTLNNLSVAHFGGGKDQTEARSPHIVTVKGTRVAMLGYSSIVGSHAATATEPGMNYLDMAPWGTLNETQVQQMEADIRSAKTKSDLVLVYYHWGTEYTHQANDDQRTVAHRAIDAGADVILGTHPHWVQGIEWYHDRLITYSLGNFIFDQEWATETKQGTLLQMTFDGDTISSASLQPYTIADYNQPAPASPDAAKATLGDIFTHSWWPK